MADVVRKASKAKRKAKSSKSTMKMKKSGKAGKEKKNGPSGKRRHKFSLEAKLGKLVSQKCYEETLRADALGAGLAVLDVTASSTTATKETRHPTALATLGACPLVSPVVLGDATREVPIAVVEICTGKDCRKSGSEAIVDALNAELPRGWKCRGSGKCISSCKRGINARLTTAIGREKFSYLDEKSARALFVPMALATNELNASFDELDDPASKFMTPRERRKSPIVAAAEAISNAVEATHSDVPPGFLPRVQT